MAFNIGDVVAKIKADTTDFQNGIQKVSGQTDVFGGVIKKLGIIAAGAFSVAKIIDFGKQASQEAMNLEKAMITLEIISGKFGVSATEAQKAAQSLGKELRIGVGSAAESLQNLLKSGLNLGQATELMKRFTNEAITGKSANISLSQAVQNLSFAYATGNSALGNMSGISENWIDITERGRETLVKQGMSVKDITDDMAKFRGIMDLTNLTLGSAERFTGTLTDKQAILGQNMVDLKVTIGNLLNPTIAFFVDKIASGVSILNNLILAIQGVNTENTFLKTTIDNITLAWNEMIVFLQPLIDWFVASVVPLLQSIWAEFTYFINMLVPPVIKVWMYLVQVIIANLLVLVNWWKTHWDSISFILKSAWEFITGIIKIAVALVLGIITVFLNLLTGNWQGAWDAIKHYSAMAWNGLKSLFNSIVDFIRGWGGLIIDALTSPFRRAWDTIKGIVEQIKSALDFTQRHSPSVVDIVTRGVKLVNGALDNLTVGLNPIDTSKLAFAGSGINGMSINVDLSGAYIGDDSIGEKIGDAIISKLQKNVRF